MDLAAIAEDAFGYVLNSPGEVRETWPTVILTHGPTPMPENGSASRIRFGRQIGDDVRAVRHWFGACGRERFVWVLGPSSTPADLEQRLRDLGAESNPTQPVATAMVLDHAPPAAPSEVELRRVRTFEDYVAMWEIVFEAFAIPEGEQEAVRATLSPRWSETANDEARWDYVALVNGQAVATGGVRRTAAGPLWLSGGATLQH